MPPGIGRGAERLLQGCLDRSVMNRWTIAMVDEVAWSVGWGAEGDDATPTPPPEKDVPHHAENIPVPPSRDWDQDGPGSRPSLKTARRRSSFRLQRSTSRSPVVARSALTRRNGSSRSISRPAPSFSAFNASILHPSSPSLSPSSSTFLGSALRTSPSPPTSLERERGRRLRKSYDNVHSTSRSPSPSVVPTTPMDVGHRGRSHLPVNMVVDNPDDIQRGRQPFGRGIYGVDVDVDMGLHEDEDVPEISLNSTDDHEVKCNRRLMSSSRSCTRNLNVKEDEENGSLMRWRERQGRELRVGRRAGSIPSWSNGGLLRFSEVTEEDSVSTSKSVKVPRRNRSAVG